MNKTENLRDLLVNIIYDNDLVNILELHRFIEQNGAEYGINNMSDINHVILDNAELFHMYFEANFEVSNRLSYDEVNEPERVYTNAIYLKMGIKHDLTDSEINVLRKALENVKVYKEDEQEALSSLKDFFIYLD